MNKSVISFLLSLTCLAAQAQTRVDFAALSPSNDIYYYKGRPFTGTSVSMYDDRTRAEEVTWKDGRMHGLKTEFYKNGVVHAKLFFEEGKRNGPFTYYYPNGSEKMKGNYKYDLLHGELTGFYGNGQMSYLHNYEDGVRTGWLYTWHDNGTPEQVVYTVSGKVHGTMQTWYRDSTRRSLIEYNMGVRNGKAYKWHNTGCMAEEAYYKNGLQDSVLRVFDNLLCDLIKESYYRKGMLNGPSVSFGQLGDTIQIANYENNVLHGPYVEFSEKKRETVGTYYHGEKDAYWHTGMVSHYQESEGTYDAGVKTGTWIFYDHKGRKLARQDFDENGKLKKQKLYRKID